VVSKRAILPILVIVSGLACAAAAIATVSPTRTTQNNQRKAIVVARAVIRDVVLPPGAQEVSAPAPGSSDLLARPVDQFFVASEVDRHVFWTVDASPLAVMQSISAHLPAASRLLDHGMVGSNLFATIGLRTKDWSELGPEQLVLYALALPDGSTALRADAEVQYLAPRPPAERVPTTARIVEIALTGSTTRSSLHVVRDRAIVRRIGTIVNRLPFTGHDRGVAAACPGSSSNAPFDTFTFRATLHGPILAQVAEPAATPTTASLCETTTLTIRGHHEPTLADGGILLKRAGSLIGITLTFLLVRRLALPQARSARAQVRPTPLRSCRAAPNQWRQTLRVGFRADDGATRARARMVRRAAS
jgi:hypothetical protein